MQNRFSYFLSEKYHKILCLSLLLFALLRFPSLFEPNWYGDEGIYQVIGRALVQGIPLYSGVWDNKPPLLYFIYALANGEQFIVRLLSLIFGLISVVLFYKLSEMLLKNKKLVAVITLLFSVLLASPYLEGNIANAENFILLPTFLAFLIILSSLIKQKEPISPLIQSKKTALFLGGFLLGISFMTKIVGIFDLFAIIIWIFFTHALKISMKKTGIILIGFLIPFVLISLFFLVTDNFSSYITAVFSSNISYVGYENSLFLPQGLLIGKSLLLVVFLALLFQKRKKIDQSVLFILTWFGFSLFSSFFSQRSYTHYILLSLPSLLLVGALIFQDIRKRLVFASLYVILLIGLIIHFKPFSPIKSIMYYPNFLSFLIGQKNRETYQAFFDTRTPRDYEIAEYLNMKLGKNEEVFIFGNSAQVYVLSDTLPINKYTVAYHINTPEKQAEVSQAIIAKHPKYAVITSDEPLGSILLPNYVYRLNFGDTTIYEYTN